MQIVIIGAGHIGLHLASLLSKKHHNVILVDRDPSKIEDASRGLDIATKVGCGSDIDLLENLKEFSPDILLAMTENDETNLVSCNIASDLGYPKTVARICQNHFINASKVDVLDLFRVDALLSPDLLIATEIHKLMTLQHCQNVENFAHGAIQLRSFKIPSNWKKSQIPLSKLDFPSDVKIALIKRANQENEYYNYIFPHGDDTLLVNDEITIIGKRHDVLEIQTYFGLSSKKIRSVTMVGGSRTGYHLAKLLVNEKIHVKLINRDLALSKFLADVLPGVEILNHDASDIEFLQEIKVEHSDCFVTCTRNEETNLIIAKLALQVGAKHVIARIENPSYESIAKDLGIHQTVLTHKSFENHILTLIKADKLSSMSVLHENEVEVLEIKVTYQSKIIGIPVQELAKELPSDFLFTAIHNRGKVTMVNGQTLFNPGDLVIVICHPKHIGLLDRLF